MPRRRRTILTVKAGTGQSTVNAAVPDVSRGSLARWLRSEVGVENGIYAAWQIPLYLAEDPNRVGVREAGGDLPIFA